MGEHTPGPWRYRRSAGKHPTYGIYGKRRSVDVLLRGGTDQRAIAIARTPRDCTQADILESRANARLIAAAPDLLAACEAAERWLDVAPIEYRNGVVHQGIDEGQVLGEHGHNEIAEQLRTAIAKAKGETDGDQDTSDAR